MAEEDDDLEAEDEEDEGSQSSTTSKKKLLWLLLPIFSVVAVVIGLYFSGVADSLLTVSKTEEKAPEAEQKTDASAVFFDVPELLINLSVKPGQKPVYVKVKVTLEMASVLDVEQAEKMLPRIIDSLQFYLREMRMEEIQGSGGSYRLKEEIQGRLNRILSPVKVVDVLFKEFLIQ